MWVSIIVLNYNGKPWLERCLDSLAGQSFDHGCEILLADNKSTDGSDLLAEKLTGKLPNARFIQNGANLGFCEGNNRPAALARGEFLLFLNNDAWLEKDCLAKLHAAVHETGAAAASPLILNYEDDSFQSIGAEGFDFFGLPSGRVPALAQGHRQLLMPEGCAYLIRRDVFELLGGFDPEIFMYADEYDLSWRLWVSGYSAITVPEARVHHRGAANVNPAGGASVIEFRTSDTKRYYANRNCLLVLLKNSQHILFLLVLLQLILLTLESLAALLVVRRWGFVRKAYWNAVRDCWRLRHHIRRERRKLNRLRKRSDFDMLNFLNWRFNRWEEIKRMFAFGLPRVAPK